MARCPNTLPVPMKARAKDCEQASEAKSVLQQMEIVLTLILTQLKLPRSCGLVREESNRPYGWLLRASSSFLSKYMHVCSALDYSIVWSCSSLWSAFLADDRIANFMHGVIQPSCMLLESTFIR